MRKIDSQVFAFLISLAVVFLLGLGTLVLAADTSMLPPGLATAEAVQEGAKVEGVLKNSETDNFKIDLNAGYQLRAFGSATKNGTAEAKLIINTVNAKGAKLSTGQVTADGMANAEAFFYKGLTQADSTNPETVYIEVKAEGPAGGSLNYRVSFEKTDRSDAGANADAGDQLTSALDLQLPKDTASFDKNFLGKNPCGSNDQPKYCSTDAKDVYTFSPLAGKTIDVQVIPSAKLNLTATLLDQNQNTLKTATSASDGAIVSLDYTSAANQQIYLEITSPAQSFFGSYSLQFTQTTGAAVSPTSVASTATTPGATAIPTPTSSPAAGFDIWAYKNYLIIGGIIIVVIVVLWLVLSLMRKKQMQTSTAEIEQLRQQMKGGPTSTPAGPSQPKTVPTIGSARTMHSDMRRLPPSRPAPRPAIPPRSNPSVAPRRSVGSAQPSFMPAIRRPSAGPSTDPLGRARQGEASGLRSEPAPVPADSDIGTFPRKAPAPNALPTASAPPAVPTPTRPTPPPPPAESAGGAPLRRGPIPVRAAPSSPPAPPSLHPAPPEGGTTRSAPAGAPIPPPASRMDEKAKADIDQIFGA